LPRGKNQSAVEVFFELERQKADAEILDQVNKLVSENPDHHISKNIMHEVKNYPKKRRKQLIEILNEDTQPTSNELSSISKLSRTEEVAYHITGTKLINRRGSSATEARRKCKVNSCKLKTKFFCLSCPGSPPICNKHVLYYHRKETPQYEKPTYLTNCATPERIRCAKKARSKRRQSSKKPLANRPNNKF